LALAPEHEPTGIRHVLNWFKSNDSGETPVEYGLQIAIIVTAGVALFRALAPI
jgi:Flp pilus assembly pilin Flp